MWNVQFYGIVLRSSSGGSCQVPLLKKPMLNSSGWRMSVLRVIGSAVAVFVFMAASPALAAITGTGRDRETNSPLASRRAAAYTASGFLLATSTTDSQGRYTLNVPAGSYRVLAFDQEGVYATTFASNA